MPTFLRLVLVTFLASACRDAGSREVDRSRGEHASSRTQSPDDRTDSPIAPETPIPPGRLEPPVARELATDRQTLAVGARHVCAILRDGGVACFGANDAGQLGLGDTEPHGGAVRVPGLSQVVAIAAGSAHTCALNGDGTVRCWGSHEDGRLGHGAPAGGSSPAPVEVRDLTGVVEIEVSSIRTCARRRDGSVACWGASEGRVLGVPAPTLPGLLPTLDDAIDIAVDRSVTCAVRRGGTLECSLGSRLSAAREPLPGVVDAIRVDVTAFEVGTGGCDDRGCWSGSRHMTRACALRSSNEIVCSSIERSESGAILFGPLEPVVPMPPLADFMAIGRSVCVLDRRGGLTCHGADRPIPEGIAPADEVVFGDLAICSRRRSDVRCASWNPAFLTAVGAAEGAVRTFPLAGL